MAAMWDDQPLDDGAGWERAETTGRQARMQGDVFADLPDDYAAQGDPRLVMRETLALVDELRLG